jgi:hypothetical protein
MQIIILKIEAFINNNLKEILFYFLLIYFFSMFLYPLYMGGGSWKYLHEVWYDWQAWNVGLLAFASTLILFNISRYQAAQQIHRELIATRAFMPEALSELNQYCHDSVTILKVMHEAFREEEKDRAFFESRLKKPISLPVEPTKYREVFSKCISLSDAKLSEYLAHILKCMQVQNSRISGMYSTYSGKSQTIWGTPGTLTGMVMLCELYQLINNLFSYARGEQETFNTTELTMKTFDISIHGLNLLAYQDELITRFEQKLETKEDSWRLNWSKR